MAVSQLNSEDDLFPCPCCGYLMFSELGCFEICEICWWEDDIVQLGFPHFAGGANKPSLYEAQKNFLSFGASTLRLKEEVRAASRNDHRDSEWRPLDLQADRILHFGSSKDRDQWADHPWDRSLYYWRSDYWLSQPRPD